MYPRNLTFYRFPRATNLSQLEELLPEHLCQDVGPLALTSTGFVSPFGGDSEVYVHRTGDSIWLTLEHQERMLPGAVVADALAKRLDEFEEREGRRPLGAARKRLRDDLIGELLPRAFVRRRRTNILLNARYGLLAVDAAGRKVADDAVTYLRLLLGSFPAVPLNAEIAPRAVLTGWLAGESLPEYLRLGEEAELRDPIQGGAVVKVQHQELQSEEVRNHLEAGKQCARLALVYGDHLSYVLGEDLVVRKLKFLEGALESLDVDETSTDAVRAEIDARLHLAGAEIELLFSVLVVSFRLSSLEQQGRA